MATPVSVGGLASGLDTNSIITGLMNIEKVPLTQLQTRQSTVDSAKSTIDGIITQLATLRTAASSLVKASDYDSFSATSSDPAVVATTTGAALPGSFDVTVSSLAREQRSYSNPQSSSSTALGMAGTLSIGIGSKSANVAIASTDTLTDIAAKISSSGARVSAAVVFDGSNYHLQVRGLDTGSANAITFGESGFSLGLSKTSNLATAASDAAFTVDGIPMTRSTNQVAGAIPGVTLALTKTTTSAASVQVSSDSSSIATKIQSLVTAYNAVVTSSQTATGYASKAASNSELAGDPSLRATLDRIGKAISSTVAGTSGRYTTLSSIGLSKDETGKLQFDATKLSSAIADDPSGVEALFVHDPSTGKTGAMQGLMDSIDVVATNANALLKSRSDSLAKLSTSLVDNETSMQKHLDEYQTLLTKQFSDMESLVSKFNTQLSAITAFTNANSNSSSK